MILDLKNELHKRAFITAAGEYLTEWEAVNAQDLHDELEEENLDGITVCEPWENYPAEDILDEIKGLARRFVIFHESETRQAFSDLVKTLNPEPAEQ